MGRTGLEEVGRLDVAEAYEVLETGLEGPLHAAWSISFGAAGSAIAAALPESPGPNLLKIRGMDALTLA